MRAVLQYRKEYSAHPSDYEIKMRLQESEMNAAEAFYEDGVALRDQGLLDDAIYQFREGLTAMPNNEKISNALAATLKEKEAGTFYQQAVDMEKAGKAEDARNLLDQALAADPGHAGAKALRDKIESEARAKGGGLALASREPISLHFNHTDLKAAFRFIGKAFGVNVIFDDSVKGLEVDLSAENVTFEQALDLILHTTRTFYKQIGPNTLLVFDDTKEKRGQYEDLLVKTVQLNSIRASEMAQILKSAIDMKQVIVNEALNTLILRDTRDVLDLADKIITANDRPPAEVLLDVEILEVNRNKVEQLGLNYGSVLTFSPPQTTSLSDIGNSNFLDILGRGTLTLPAVTFNYFKQDVDAKTLAHPQIRVVDNKEAKIHIGDRVPLPSAVIQQTTGQVQITYNYSDIGVLLNVTPVIGLDRTVLVKLNLEVSSLGANLGTSANPAYQIGTRDATTTMLLHDGESAILGGLIQDSERQTHAKVPFLGDIPILGRIFATSSDESSQRTDILLTMTPRIVRDWTFPHKEFQEIYSGTRENPSNRPLFSPFQRRAEGGAAPKIEVGQPESPAPTVSATPVPILPFQGASGGSPEAGGLVLSFSAPQYEVGLGQPVTLKLYGENIGELKTLPLAVAFNANYLKFVAAGAGSDRVEKVESDSDEKHGMVRLRLNLRQDSKARGPVELVELTLNGYTPGISYLVFLNPSFKDPNGKEIRAEAHASRVAVR